MLCIGTVQAKESKVIEQPKIEQSCIDVGINLQVQVIQFDRVSDTRQIVTNSYTIEKQDKQSTDKQILQKDALYSRYIFIPDCKVEFIGKHRTKYLTHYAYSFCNTYNQPPSK